jgi:broad specificity phosphatase PhoE
MVRWYLVRHGRTELNRDNRVQGHSQTLLDKEGLSQAGKLRDRLAEETFTAAFSSDLARAQQTAQTILGNRKITLTVSPDLREFDYGLWNNLTLAELRDKYSDEMSRMMDSNSNFAPPNGESLIQLLERTSRFVNQVRGQVPEGNLLVVCHGGSLRGLAVHLLGLPIDKFWSLQVDLASLSIVDVYPNRSVLVLFNDISHLRNMP